MAKEPHIPTRPFYRGPHEYRRGSFQNTLEVCDRALGKRRWATPQLPNSPSLRKLHKPLTCPNLKIASETHQNPTRQSTALQSKGRHYKLRRRLVSYGRMNGWIYTALKSGRQREKQKGQTGETRSLARSLSRPSQAALPFVSTQGIRAA